MGDDGAFVTIDILLVEDLFNELPWEYRKSPGLSNDERAAASEMWAPPSEGVTLATGDVELKTAVPLGSTGGSAVLS